MISQFINQNFFFLFLLFFAYFSYVRFVYANQNLFLLSVFFLPATFFHELAHFFFGFITLANPVNFSIFPKKEGEYYTLGSVNFNNINNFNALITGIAPVVLLVLLFFLDKNNFYLYKKVLHKSDLGFFDILLLSYINFIFVYSGIPSTQDFKVIFSKKLGLFFWILIITGGIFFMYQQEFISVIFEIKNKIL